MQYLTNILYLIVRLLKRSLKMNDETNLDYTETDITLLDITDMDISELTEFNDGDFELNETKEKSSSRNYLSIAKSALQSTKIIPMPDCLDKSFYNIH